MGKKNPAVDAYIAAAADFARPILGRLRRLFHEACPAIEETMKWSCPHFEYRGIVGGMAAFKQHVRWGLWKGNLISDPHGVFADTGRLTMRDGKVTDVSQLPADAILLEYLRAAVALNEQGVKVPKKKPAKKPPLVVPDYFRAALKKNKKALATFEAFSPSHQREYVDWVAEAKQEATRQKRLATALEWLAEGKSRNWKYERK